MLSFLMVFAQGGDAGAGAGQGGQPGWFMMMPLLVMAALFFFMMSRNAKRQERERQAMLGSLDKGDKVLTAGGIYGTVVSVSQTEDEVVVKVDDNARLKVSKAAISRNVTKEEARAAQAKS